MAGQYDGQSASAFTKGLQSGYSFIDKAFAAEDEAEKRKLLIEKQKKENELYDVAMQDARNQQQTAEQEQITKMNQEMQQMQQVQKKQNGAVASQDLNSLIVAGDTATRDKAIQTVSAKMRANPSAYEAFGVKPNSSINVVNIADTKHKAKLTEYLNAQGISAEAFEYDTTTEEGKTAWSNKITEYANQLPALMVDGTFVPLSELGIAVGSSLQMTPDQAKMQETNWATLQKLSDDMPVDERPEQPAAQEMPQGADDVVNANNPDELAAAEAQAGMVTDGTMVPGQPQMGPQGQPQTSVDTEIEQASKMNAITDYNQKREQGANYQGNPYTRWNKDDKDKGSEAYGKYQIMPKTYATLAKRLGMTYDEIRTPEGQELAFKELTRENSVFLEEWGVADTPASQYVVHQLGSTQAKKYFEGNIDSKVMSSMKNQYSPKAIKGMSDNEIVAKWTRDFNMDDNGGVIDTTPVKEMSRTVSKKADGASQWDMEKVYALLGKTYPDKKTTKMKDWNFLTTQGKLTEGEATRMVYGQKAGSLTTLEKLYAARSSYPVGTPEYQQYTDAINGESNKYNQSKSQAGIEKYNNTIAALSDRDDLTPAEETKLKAAQEAVYKNNVTAAIRTGETKMVKLAAASKVAKPSIQKIIDDKSITPKEVQNLEDAELANIIFYPANAMKGDYDIVDEMTMRQTSINSMISLSNDLDNPNKNISNYKRGVMDNVTNFVGEITNPEIVKAIEDEFGGNWQNEISASVEKTGRTGYIQAQFIKAMSGTAASDAERQFLIDVMQSGNWNDEKYLKQSLETFVGMMKEENTTKFSQADKLPKSAYDATQYMERVKEQPKEEPVMHMGKEVARTGMQNGKKVVLYTDGTQWVQP